MNMRGIFGELFKVVRGFIVRFVVMTVAALALNAN
jgi:hypothetical protein